jgi:hypothetical protein
MPPPIAPHSPGYASDVAAKPVVTVPADLVSEDVLAAAGLRPGQPVVAEAMDDGLLLRAASDAELAAAGVSADEVRALAARYPRTLERLGS